MATASWVLVLCYMAVILFFVIRGARKTTNISDYAVGSLAFSPMAVGLALAASMTSAATFIINPGFVALYGISGVISYALVLPAAALVSLVIFTKGFRKHGSAVKALTMAQWIGTRYKSRPYAIFFAFLSLLLLTFVVLIVVGLTKVLSSSLGVHETYVLIGLVVFTFGYMMFGGANSMVYTNTIQAVLMLVVAFILLGSGYEHFSEGVQGFLAKLESIDPNLAASTNPDSPLFRDYFEIVLCQIVIGVAIVCQPHIITKSLLLKKESDVNKFLVTGIVAEVIFFLVVITGLYARLRFPDLKVDGAAVKMDGIIPAYVIKEFPVYLGLIVVMGLLSAGLSTLEGLIQSLSTTITSDIIKPLFGARIASEDSPRWVAVNRLVIVGIAIAAALFSYQQIVSPNLSVALFAQNGVYAFFSAAFVPVLFGTFLKDTPKIAPIVASATAVTVHFAVYYIGITAYMQGPVRNPAIAATLGILTSLVVGIVLYLVFREKDQRVATHKQVAS